MNIYIIYSFEEIISLKIPKLGCLKHLNDKVAYLTYLHIVGICLYYLLFINNYQKYHPHIKNIILWKKKIVMGF